MAFVLVMSELSVPVYATETGENVAAEEVLTEASEASDDTDDTKKLITSDESAETEKTADADEQAESEDTSDDKATDDAASDSSATEEDEAEYESEDDSFFAEEDEVVPEAETEDGDENDGDEELHGLGYNYIPGEGDVESIEVYGDDDEFQDININDPLLSSYVTADLPNLRNQGGYGTCWAHSAMATAEINKMKQNYDPSLNYSELHLAYFTYEKKNSADPLGGTTGDKNEAKYNYNKYDREYCPDFMQRGGNHEFVSNVLASWIGAADESKAPYGQAASAISSGLDESIAYDDAAHLKNFYRVNTGDRDAIKRIVRDCGAAEVSFFAIQDGETITSNGTSLSFSDVYRGGSNYNCYYFPLVNCGTNHSVTIVGWDDNFQASKFARTPGGNGAWLVRNSWSSGNISNKSFEGYFWLSYYDKSIATTSAWGYEYSDTVYDHNYQYDGAMNTGWTTYGSSQIYSANVFTAKGNPDGEILRAVGINTYQNTNVSYEVKVYKNLSNAKVPTSGTCVSSVTGKTTYCGFYTVPLLDEVELDPGEVFSVVVKFQKSGDQVYAAVERSSEYTWYKITASSKAGQSFLSYNGSSWEDYGASGNGNIRIKAFTSNDTGNKVTITLNAEGGKFSNGQSVMKKTVHPEEPYGTLPTPTKANCEFIGWFLDDGVTEITADDTVPDAGDHTLYAHWIGKTINVTLNPKGGSIDGSMANKTVQVRYGETYGTLPPPQYAGYDFKGWFTSASGTEKVKADTVVTKTSDHTLYAQYNANKYTVTYDPDG
ncbi:MAG: InlB B-repeat-containing protein, partial [Lachnospiraceae bacterium]|nr:InlB B-repeat-containing protein [Lachnospiraceae bacterium]